MTTWGLQEPFDIDNGELDGLRPQDCFVLGAEWQLVSQQLDSGEAFSRPLHLANSERIKRMCIRRGRKFRTKPNGLEWLWLEVAGEGGEFLKQEDER